MSHSAPTPQPGAAVKNAARVIIVGSVMFSFISYWRTAAVVLCDLGSTAYYIGGIVEEAIGAAAPWFILAVMVFSYAVRSVYIESCSMFIRGGVYRVVKEALGRFVAKIAVSALIFDYLLTGPISGVSAGHYLMGLVFDTLVNINSNWSLDPATRKIYEAWGSVLICILITLYFYRSNIIGIHESSERALNIMMAATVMIVVILVWCGATLALKGIAKNTQTGQTNTLPVLPDFRTEQEKHPGKHVEQPKVEVAGEHLGRPDPTLGFLNGTEVGDRMRQLYPGSGGWLSIFGLMGILIAFGHSILAMSGEETLAQVYREVESPKLQNFQKAAFIVFIYSLVFTVGVSFLAVLLIPEDQRVSRYSANLISGLAMNVAGPEFLRLGLNFFVVMIGVLILAGAVNTAIIGSNGVLNRVAEDGVMHEWFLKPHARYGTTYRILTMIVVLQIIIILISGGDVILLGEAYAFGVVWSFVFQAVAMVVLRFKDPRPREYKVPLNLRLFGVEIPFGLLLVLLTLISAALMNLLTKQLATISGLSFTAAFFIIFLVSEYVRDLKLKDSKTGKHEHVEQFNQQTEQGLDPASLGLKKPYRKLVAIRSTQNLIMLEKALAETDPETTDLVVMTAKTVPEGGSPETDERLDSYDKQLMTAVVQRAESAGKPVCPLIVPTNNPLFALLNTALQIRAQEVVVGASNKYTADEQLDQLSLFWINLNQGELKPLSVRVLGKDRDLYFDLGGGNRIPKFAERRARSVAELRQAGVGVDRVLAVLSDSTQGFDLFQSVLTMLDPKVALSLAVVAEENGENDAGRNGALRRLVEEHADQLDRPVQFEAIAGELAPQIVDQARTAGTDLIIVMLGDVKPRQASLPLPPWVEQVLRQAHCRVFVTITPPIPEALAPA